MLCITINVLAQYLVVLHVPCNGKLTIRQGVLLLEYYFLLSLLAYILDASSHILFCNCLC